MADSTGDNRSHRSLLAMLHEQSHLLGAGGKADTNHGECIMSYNRTYGQMLNLLNDPDSYDNLYCTDCKQAIRDYLENNL